MGLNRGEIKATITPKSNITANIGVGKQGGGGGTNNYNELTNKPSINTHTLVGDSDFEDIGLHFMTNIELQQLLGG